MSCSGGRQASFRSPHSPPKVTPSLPEERPLRCPLHAVATRLPLGFSAEISQPRVSCRAAGSLGKMVGAKSRDSPAGERADDSTHGRRQSARQGQRSAAACWGKDRHKDETACGQGSPAAISRQSDPTASNRGHPACLSRPSEVWPSSVRKALRSPGAVHPATLRHPSNAFLPKTVTAAPTPASCL